MTSGPIPSPDNTAIFKFMGVVIFLIKSLSILHASMIWCISSSITSFLYLQILKTQGKRRLTVLC
jgi:hypothetical protein